MTDSTPPFGKKGTDLLSPGIVREVSRTAVPALVSGWVLTIGDLIERTAGSDWDGCYYILTAPAAKRISRQINKEKPWRTPRVVPAITAGQAIRSIAAASRTCTLPALDAGEETIVEHGLAILDGELVL